MSENDNPEAESPEEKPLARADLSSILGESGFRKSAFGSGNRPSLQRPPQKPSILSQPHSTPAEDNDVEDEINSPPAKPRGLFTPLSAKEDETDEIDDLSDIVEDKSELDSFAVETTFDAEHDLDVFASDASEAASEPAVTEPAFDHTENITAETNADDSTTDTDEAEIPITYHYRVAVVLHPSLELQMNIARQSAGIPVAAPGIFALQTDFTTDDSEAVEAAIKTWVSEYLPLKVNLERVDAAVIGEQRYVAGMALEPADVLTTAQAALAAALAEHTQIAMENPLPFAPRLLISDHTPAAAFPHLLHALENHFEPGAWAIQAVELLRTPENDDRWEVVEKFSA